MSLLEGAILEHVAIPCRDISASVKFYLQLGFVKGFGRMEPPLQQMQLGDRMVELIAVDIGAQGSSSIAHFALRVESASDAWDQLGKAGIHPDGPVRRGGSGAEFFFIQDPDGNRIEILSR